MWLAAMWNPMQGQYMLSPTLPPPQVPWMSVGLIPSWTPAQYPWTVPQAALPPQASNLLLNLSNPGQGSIGAQNQSQAGTQPAVPVTTTMVTTTMLVGAQPPTLLPLPMMHALSARDAAGNLQLKIANHVLVATRNKIWQYQYVDLASLNTDIVPDEVTYGFYPNHDENKISFKAAKLHGKITNYTSWNKAFHILTELIAVKCPNKCLDMVQYVATISDLQGKFPFQQAYAYDKKFHQGIQHNITQQWAIIDNQLWSKELHGTALTPTNESNCEQNFCTCNDYNRGKCTRKFCRFAHQCNKCNWNGHPATNCRSRSSSSDTSCAVPNWVTPVLYAW